MSVSLWPTLDDIMYPPEDNPLTILQAQMYNASHIDDSIEVYIVQEDNSASLLIKGTYSQSWVTVVKLSWERERKHWYPIKASGIINELECLITSAANLKGFLETSFKSDSCVKLLYKIITRNYCF